LEQLTKSAPKKLRQLLRLSISLGAIFYLFSNIDRDVLFVILKKTDLWWLFWAFIAFNLSKIVSAIRLNYYFRSIGIALSEWRNLQLYYLGMFYNLFLPGGISGDGYKIYLLAKRHGRNYKKLLQATLLDRISGLAALFVLGGMLYAVSRFASLSTVFQILALSGAVLAIPVNYLITKRFFADYLAIFLPTTLYAFVVQLLQLLCALFLIWAINAPPSMTVEYLALFLISSVVAILPISIGGIGVRELTFLYGFGLIGGDTTSAVAFSLLFFLITVLSSLLGLFVKSDFHPNH